MNNGILDSISCKNDYLTVLEAVAGTKTSFTEEEKDKLLSIYIQIAESGLWFSDETLVKAVLALDVPGANLLGEADSDALTALSALCKCREPSVEKAETVKDSALSGDVSQPLTLALARAALDACVGQSDLTPYREEIETLAEFLKQADEEAFAGASAFLIRVRERVRTR